LQSGQKVTATGTPPINITGQAPFTGTLIHKGWQVTEIKLPKISETHNVSIITPAEVEL
jgi:hypothetical protein